MGGNRGHRKGACFVNCCVKVVIPSPKSSLLKIVRVARCSLELVLESLSSVLLRF